MDFTNTEHLDRLPKGRVLHVIYSMKQGGAERLLLDDVVAQESPGDGQGEFPGLVVCWNHEGILAEQLRTAGVPYLVLDRRLRPIWKLPLFLSDLRTLVSSIRKIATITQAPIIHGHLIDSTLLAALASNGKTTKSVTTIYSNHVIPMSIPKGGAKYAIWNAIARWSLKRVDRVVSISTDVTQTLVKGFGVPEENLIERPISVEAVTLTRSAPEARALFDVADNELCLAFVGRLVENKNQACLIRMVGILRSRGVPVRLLLVGDGPDKDMLSQTAREHDVADHVRLLGHYKDLPAVMAACDIFVTASKSEGVSLALLEAMSAEVPIVSTNNEGNSDLLKDGIGTLVTGTTDTALADAVEALWRDDTARSRQVATAKAFFDTYRRASVEAGGSNFVYRDVLSMGPA